MRHPSLVIIGCQCERIPGKHRRRSIFPSCGVGCGKDGVGCHSKGECVIQIVYRGNVTQDSVEVERERRDCARLHTRGSKVAGRIQVLLLDIFCSRLVGRREGRVAVGGRRCTHLTTARLQGKV